MPKFLQSLPPGQRRAAMAAALGGLLALVVVIRRRGTSGGGGGSATPTPAPTADTGGAALTGPSTFADNGASAGALSTTVADNTGAIQELTSAFYDWMQGQPAADAPADVATPTQPVPAVTGAPSGLGTGQLSTVGAAVTNPMGGSSPKSVLHAVAGKPGVFHNDSRNLDYVIHDGVRRYETAPGKGDWMKGAAIPIPKKK